MTEVDLVNRLTYTEVLCRPDLGPCWEWNASRNEDRGGYGQIRVDGQVMRAHRVAYTLWVGEIPAGDNVLHHCDNPPCIRPKHLFLGSHADNAADRVAKGRNVSPRFPSQETPARKLTAEQAMEIRERAEAGESITALGHEFNVTKQNIARIKKGETWTSEKMTP